MSKQDSLFELVKSLNQSEKRYFRIFASRHGSENKYMKIFSVLDSLDEYEEETLKAAIKKEKIKGNVSRVKTYLKDLILKSLIAFHADSSVRNRIKDILRTVEVLFQKSLGKQCQKQLEKAEKLALENDELLLMLEIIEWKGKLVRLVGIPGDPETFFKETNEEIAGYLEKVQNLFHYNELSLMLQIFSMSRGHGRSEEDTRRVDRILSHPLLQDEQFALSFEAKIRFHSLKAYIGINHFNFDFAYGHLEQLLALMESRPTVLPEVRKIYLSNLRNIILVSRYRERHDLARKWITRLQASSTKLLGPKVKQKNATEYFANIISKLDFYKDTGETQKAMEIIRGFERDFQKVRPLLRDSLLIAYFYISGVVYFIEENYHQAVKSFTEVINFPNISLREDLHCMTRLILLLSHYELGNIDLLSYLVKAASRYLTKKQRLFQVEARLLKFIRKDFVEVKGTSRWKEALIQLKAELTEITQSPHEKKALKYFDFIAFLDSRIHNRSFREVLQEQDAPSTIAVES